MNIYLSGPMRRMPGFNWHAFDNAARYLQSMGHTVFNPAEQDRLKGFDFANLTGNENLEDLGFSIRAALAEDLQWIAFKADVVAVLPGWPLSSGALAEVALAHAIGIPVAQYNMIDEEGIIREIPASSRDRRRSGVV